jgi:hypothetical protein
MTAASMVTTSTSAATAVAATGNTAVVPSRGFGSMPIDPGLHVFQYLMTGEDAAAMSALNRNWRIIATRHWRSVEGLSAKDNESVRPTLLQKKYLEIDQKRKLIVQMRETTLRSLGGQIGEKEKEIRGKKQELEKARGTKANTEALEKGLGVLEAEKKTLDGDFEKTYDKMKQLEGEIQQLQWEYGSASRKSKKLWMAMFGGEKGFDQVPILQLKGKARNDISYLSIYDLTAPVMRGFYKDRLFFTVVAKKEGKFVASTIFQAWSRAYDEIWVCKMENCYQIMTAGPNFITAGRFQRDGLNGAMMHTALSNLIQGKPATVDDLSWIPDDPSIKTCTPVTRADMLARKYVFQWVKGMPERFQIRFWFKPR